MSGSKDWRKRTTSQPSKPGGSSSESRTTTSGIASKDWRKRETDQPSKPSGASADSERPPFLRNPPEPPTDADIGESPGGEPRVWTADLIQKWLDNKKLKPGHSARQWHIDTLAAERKIAYLRREEMEREKKKKDSETSKEQEKGETDTLPSLKSLVINQRHMSHQELLNRENPLFKSKKPILARSGRPSEEILMEEFAKNSLFMRTLESDFCNGIDMWIRGIVFGYITVSVEECMLSKMRDEPWIIGAVFSFDELMMGLTGELNKLQRTKKLESTTGEPGSWAYLDNPRYVEVLKTHVHHNRLFRILEELDYKPHHWSAAIYVRRRWCLIPEEDEPASLIECGYSEVDLGRLEFAIKTFLEHVSIMYEVDKVLPVSAQRYKCGDNKKLHQHLGEISEMYRPTARDEKVWWDES